MSAFSGERVATLRGAPDHLSVRTPARFLTLMSILFLAHVLFEPALTLGEVGPDFYLIGLVFCALRWGPLAGCLLGFVLGLNVDSTLAEHFGMHALAFTTAGFAMGKMKESLYLDLPALDVILLLTAGLFTGLVTTAVANHTSFAAFEDRFFYEVPLSALITAVAGGLLFRLLRS